MQTHMFIYYIQSYISIYVCVYVHMYIKQSPAHLTGYHSDKSQPFSMEILFLNYYYFSTCFL